MSLFLPTIFERGDRAALTLWLQSPEADLFIGDDLGWNGSVEEGIGRDLCAVLARTKGWQGGLTLAHLLPRLTHAHSRTPRHQVFAHAILLHVTRPEATLSAQDGHNILMALHLFQDPREAGLPHLPFFAPLYGAIAHALPLGDVLASAEHKIRGSFATSVLPLAIPLAAYGAPAFGHCQGLLRSLHSRGLFEHRGAAENALLGRIGHASAHASLSLLACMDIAAHRHLSPVLFWARLLRIAHTTLPG